MERKLGRGLEALIPEDVVKEKTKTNTLRIDEISPNSLQPRQVFESGAMEDLKNSIREKGIIQPVLVRKKDNVYELIAGERRWRAAKELGIQDIPVVFRDDADDVSSLELSLIENIQREELNPIEEARAYKSLMEKYGHTLDKVGQMVGKDKTTISNSLRLLNLPEDIQDLVRGGKISVGHAKVLLSVTNDYRQRKLAQLIMNKGFSVRQSERFSLKYVDAKKRSKKESNPEIQSLEEQLQHYLGTKVKIAHGKTRGRIEISYFSNDDLSRILNLLLR